jgi:hypothetical protein
MSQFIFTQCVTLRISFPPHENNHGKPRLGLKTQAQGSNRLKPVALFQLILDTPKSFPGCPISADGVGSGHDETPYRTITSPGPPGDFTFCDAVRPIWLREKERHARI